MITFEPLLTTFEARGFLRQLEKYKKLAEALNQTTITKFNKVKLAHNSTEHKYNCKNQFD